MVFSLPFAVLEAVHETLCQDTRASYLRSTGRPARIHADMPPATFFAPSPRERLMPVTTSTITVDDNYEFDL